jgi:hypothetical protein
MDIFPQSSINWAHGTNFKRFGLKFEFSYKKVLTDLQQVYYFVPACPFASQEKKQTLCGWPWTLK